MARSIQFVIVALTFFVAMAAGCAAEQTIQQEPSSVVLRPAELVEFDEAIILTAKLQYKAASAEFERLIQQFDSRGDRKQTAESMFWLGYCREKMGMTSVAAELYRSCAMKYPQDLSSMHAKERLDRLVLSEGGNP